MGKRKKSSRKPQAPRRKDPLATTFSCLFCNHEKAVVVKLDKRGGTGQLSCKVCGQHFQTGINYLSAAVDVYSDWVDACDAVKKGSSGPLPRGLPPLQGDGEREAYPEELPADPDHDPDPDADLPPLPFEGQDAPGEDVYDTAF